MTDPLVVTLLVDASSQARLDRERSLHFPAERNVLAAHVTLFHALPGSSLAQVLLDADEVARRAAYDVAVSGVRFLGRGVAYELASDELLALRAELRRRWEPMLTAQDRQGWRPHVTVQNKVAPEVARALHGALTTAFVPWTVTALGLSVWWYRGGPWELVRSTTPDA